MKAELLIDLEELRRVVREVLREEVREEPDCWLSYQQIVELTGLSEWTIGEAVRRGELEADYPLPRCPRVKRSKLRGWMERNTRGGGSADVPDRRRA
jgi:predicted transcriptional regulator